MDSNPVRYNIESNAVDSHQSAPYWFAACVRFANRKSLDLQKLIERKNNVTLDEVNNEPVEENPEILIIDEDCVQWNIGQSKESHLGSLQMVCLHSDKDYTKELAPGEWICFWAFNDFDNYSRVKNLVINRKKCNDWNDGLKFIGRCSSVRRSKTRQQDGMLNIGYSIAATSGYELNNSIYFDPMTMGVYAIKSGDIAWWNDLGGDINNLVISDNKGTKVFKSQQLLSKLLSILLGTGPQNKALVIKPPNYPGPMKETPPTKSYWSDLGESANKAEERTVHNTNIELQKTPNSTYLIPQTIKNWFYSSNSGPGLYCDLLKFYVGVQQYSTNDGTYRMFIPDTTPLESQFFFIPQPFSGQSVFSIMKTYINAPIDEMYTTLRVDPSGAVVPSLIARQTAFNSSAFAESHSAEFDSGNLVEVGKKRRPVTKFVDLPRWVISDSLIYNFDHGSSEILRKNYIFMMGKNVFGTTEESNKILAYTRNPPISNMGDIKRCNLMLDVRTINANLIEFETSNKESLGGFWQQLVSDAHMDSHLKHSGKISCQGIYEPICVGDNIEVDDMIFHIERITHSGSINARGIKNFSTNIDVSSGISTRTDSNIASHFIYRYESTIPTDEPTNKE